MAEIVSIQLYPRFVSVHFNLPDDERLISIDQDKCILLIDSWAQYHGFDGRRAWWQALSKPAEPMLIVNDESVSYVLWSVEMSLVSEILWMYAIGQAD